MNKQSTKVLLAITEKNKLKIQHGRMNHQRKILFRFSSMKSIPPEFLSSGIFRIVRKGNIQSEW